MAKLKSRKFWITVTSAILLVLNEGLGLEVPTDVIIPFVYLVLGYVFVEGAADVVSRIKGGK